FAEEADSPVEGIESLRFKERTVVMDLSVELLEPMSHHRKLVGEAFEVLTSLLSLGFRPVTEILGLAQPPQGFTHGRPHCGVVPIPPNQYIGGDEGRLRFPARCPRSQRGWRVLHFQADHPLSA